MFEEEKIPSLFEIKFLGVLDELLDERKGCSPLLTVYGSPFFIKILALSHPHCLFLTTFSCSASVPRPQSLYLSPRDDLSVFIVISGEMINGGRYQVTMNTL